MRAYDPAAIDKLYGEKQDSSKARQTVIEWADAIVVATPTRQHYNDILDCDNQQKPMLVEKPLTDDRVNLSLTCTAHIKMVGYNLRFHSVVKKAKQWMSAIGAPIWARFTCAQFNDKPDYLRDGVILNWSHEIDLALYLLGDAYIISATRNATESLADITIRHDGAGCRTHIHLDYLTPSERRGFVIVGTQGSMEGDLVSREARLINNQGITVDFHQGRDSFDGNYLAEARAFLERLDGHQTLGCTANEAMAVMKICLDAKDKSICAP